uniref:Pentatricopeptide repeat protein n=1 Tax=Coccidioides posadasii RMSCC 3488 TaxID=454284 RepID=A0A0J6INB4_COCPO|nr:hypothetical protein CPAG_09701 [Coccidioides posadasii RMSCC 3488]
MSSRMSASSKPANQINGMRSPPKFYFEQLSGTRLLRKRPRLCVLSLADIFISSLVIAGYCKKHSPSTRRFFSDSSNPLSAAKAAHVLVSSESTDGRGPPTTPAQRVYLEPRPVPGLNSSEASIYRSLKSELPPDAPLNPKAYLAAKRTPHPNYRQLFDFFHRTLGYEEGTKGLMVALSNPNSDMRVFGSQMSDGVEDDLETPGVKRLISLLGKDSVSNRTLFRAYRRLPSPRISCLSYWSRKILLHRFANPPRRHPHDSMRYLSIIEDMCEASLPLTPSLWTAAIALAGKSSDKVSRTSFRSALGVWRRMEYEGNVTSNSLVFNMLFDLAIKAGQYKVADKIILEMRQRGIDFSRFGRVAQIFYSGVQGDAAAVRQAYHDFVNAGELVDTAVLNCVMASLIRTGHLGLAEQMYDNMKSLHNKIVRDQRESGLPSSHLPSNDYMSYRKASKYIGRILSMAAFLHDKLPKHHRALQGALPLAPDGKTFHIFLSYHAFISGDLERFLSLLQDMENTFDSPPQGMVYLFLFEGFAKHGNKRKSDWTLERLRRAWTSFLRDMNESEQRDLTRVQQRISKLVWETRLNQRYRESEDTSDEPNLRRITTHNGENDLKASDDIMGTGVFNPYSKSEALEANGYDDDYDDEEDEYYYEHGVFLGRRIVIACLRAHSVCGGPKAVLGVWDQIKPLWRPEAQRLKDIVAVNKVLYELLPDKRP